MEQLNSVLIEGRIVCFMDKSMTIENISSRRNSKTAVKIACLLHRTPDLLKVAKACGTKKVRVVGFLDGIENNMPVVQAEHIELKPVRIGQ